MKRLLLAYALAAVDTVIFHVGATNLRSRRALEKIGAREAGFIERHTALPDGSWRDSVVYRIAKT